MKGAFIMAVKFNLRLCLQLIDRGISLNTISKQYHISKHTSSKTKHRMEVLQFDVVLLISTQMMSWVNYFSLKCTNLKTFI